MLEPPYSPGAQRPILEDNGELSEQSKEQLAEVGWDGIGWGGAPSPLLPLPSPLPPCTHAGSHLDTEVRLEEEEGPALLLSPDTRARAEERRARLLAAAREVDPGAEMLEDVVLKRGSRDYAVVMVVRLTLP